MAVCETFDPDCFGCRIRAKALSYSRAASPTARSSKAPPRTPDPAWERGLAGEQRPGGTFMPYLNAKGDPMHVKEASGQRRRIADTRRKQIQTGA